MKKDMLPVHFNSMVTLSCLREAAVVAMRKWNRLTSMIAGVPITSQLFGISLFLPQFYNCDAYTTQFHFLWME